MPGRVFLSYFVDSRADVLFQVLSAIYDLYDISDRYVAYISRYKRQFFYALFSERYFRNIPEGNIFNQTFEVCRGICIFENVIDELADLYVFDFIERFVFVEICQTEVLHIVVKRPCPGLVFGVIVGRIAENLVRYRKDYIYRVISAEQRVEERFESKVEHVRKNKRKISRFFVCSPGRIFAASAIVGKARDENVHEVADTSLGEYLIEYVRYYVVAARLNVVYYFEYFVYVKAEHVGNHAGKIFAVGLLPTGRILLDIER